MLSIKYNLSFLCSFFFAGNVQSQQIWGFPRYETRSAGLQCAAGEACVYLGVVCECWDESNHGMMWKACHTPPPYQNKSTPLWSDRNPAIAHTHTCQSWERRTEAVFTLWFDWLVWTRLLFHPHPLLFSYCVIQYMAPNHRVSSWL